MVLRTVSRSDDEGIFYSFLHLVSPSGIQSLDPRICKVIAWEWGEMDLRLFQSENRISVEKKYTEGDLLDNGCLAGAPPLHLLHGEPVAVVQVDDDSSGHLYLKLVTVTWQDDYTIIQGYQV